MLLHASADAAQDFQCLLRGRFLDVHLLKPTFESGVLFDVKPIFRDRRGSDNADITTGEGGFQDIRGIHRAPCLSGAHQCVDLVQKEDDVGIRRGFLDGRLPQGFNVPMPTDSAELTEDEDPLEDDQMVLIHDELMGAEAPLNDGDDASAENEEALVTALADEGTDYADEVGSEQESPVENSEKQH